ncbi:hypothetical protein B0H13DRAFT_1027828 [Mycena leptocephala]|nr:hypothetical protein B0H13DRAFT_1027828 [Mycena leptocephala]
MPLLAAALTYGSFGDIKETAKLTRRIIEILYDGGRPSSEGERIILVLKDLYKDVATVLILPGIDSSSAHAQSAVGELSAKLALCHSLLAKLYAKIRPSNSFLAKVWMVISEEKALASWRAEITEHRASLHTTLQSLNIAISNESREQLELVRSNVQYIRAEVERVGFQVHSLESQTVVASNHLVSQVSNVENQLRQLIQKMSLHDVSEPMFFVTDPLRRCTIPIPLFYCVDFNALHAILIAYLRNRPEAGARYVERGDYNIVSPEGVVVRRVQFAGIVKAGMRFDMSIVKRQKHQVRPNLEECPNCHQINPKVRCNEWIDCSNPECGQRYQISAKIAREEIYSQQLSYERSILYRWAE